MWRCVSCCRDGSGQPFSIVLRGAATDLPQGHLCLPSVLGVSPSWAQTAGKLVVTHLTPCPLVMWCSAAVDVLFLIDGSHSVGKGSFERAKHFAIRVCDALDINPKRVSTVLLSFY